MAQKTNGVFFSLSLLVVDDNYYELAIRKEGRKPKRWENGKLKMPPALRCESSLRRTTTMLRLHVDPREFVDDFQSNRRIRFRLVLDFD